MRSSSHWLGHVALRRFTWVLVILMSVKGAEAQDGPAARAAVALRDADVIRLGDVYREVLERNPRTAAVRALADAASARIAAASLLPDPQVQLAFMNYGLWDLRPMDPTGMVQLQVTQMLPAPGKLGLSGRIAEARAAAERERAIDVDWDLRSLAAMAYYEVHEAEQSAAIATATRRLVQDIERIASTMYQVGEGRQADVLRAQVEIARMTEEITRMEAMRVAAAARLNALLDRAVDAPVPSPVLPAFPAEVPRVDSLAVLAAGSRPMIRAGEEDVEAADAMVDLARRELVPDLMIGVQYGQRSAVMGTERMGSLMLGASVPVFAARRQLRLRDEAVAMRSMAVADLQYMRAETRGRVGTAHAALMRARNLARLYETTVLPQAQAALASALAAYRVGRVDFMTLLDDQMTVNRYRMELVALEAEEGRSWAELEMLTGRELINPNSVARAAEQGPGGSNND